MFRQNEQREVCDFALEVCHFRRDALESTAAVKTKVENVLADELKDTNDEHKKKQVDALVNQRVQLWKAHGLLAKGALLVRKHRNKAELIRQTHRQYKVMIQRKIASGLPPAEWNLDLSDNEFGHMELSDDELNAD